MLAESDIVSLDAPLPERTRGLIGASELAAMKRATYLINTCRGPVVDELALIDALAAEPAQTRRCNSRRPSRGVTMAAAGNTAIRSKAWISHSSCSQGVACKTGMRTSCSVRLKSNRVGRCTDVTDCSRQPLAPS